MADHLSDIALRMIRDQQPPSSYNRESLLQVLKRSLDESPTEPLRIDALKRLLLPHTPSTSLFSPHQAIQRALDLAEHRIRTYFRQPDLFFPPLHLGFFAYRDLFELLFPAPRSVEREHLDVYEQAFAGAILELAGGGGSRCPAGRWPGGCDRTRDEVKRFVSLGREAIPSMKRDRLGEVVKHAINSVKNGRDKLCPLQDAMNVLSQMPPDSSMAEIIVHRLVLHSKPLPTEQYSSLMRSCMNHLINLSANQTSARSIDVEEFACFFAPDVILMMGMTSQDNHTLEENNGGSSSSQAHGAIHDRPEMNYEAPYPEMEAKIDEVLRDALMDAVERLERLESSIAMEESSNNDSMEAIIYAFLDAMESAPSLTRNLLRQVLIDSKEPPQESLVDQAFIRIVFSAMDSINRSSGYCSEHIVEYLLDAIEDQIKSSVMKQALVKRLVFSFRPPPVELSGGHVLHTSIAAGVRQLAEELSVERPLEAMAGAIRRLPFAGPVVKKILLLIVSNVEEPRKKLPHGKKKVCRVRLLMESKSPHRWRVRST